jgi:hypothetical protein
MYFLLEKVVVVVHYLSMYVAWLMKRVFGFQRKMSVCFCVVFLMVIVLGVGFFSFYIFVFLLIFFLSFYNTCIYDNIDGKCNIDYCFFREMFVVVYLFNYCFTWLILLVLSAKKIMIARYHRMIFVVKTHVINVPIIPHALMVILLLLFFLVICFSKWKMSVGEMLIFINKSF